MRRWARLLILWFILGEQYFVLEAVYRLFRGERAHVAMLAVGGLAMVLVGAVNQCQRFYKLPVLAQSLIGAGIVLAVEFAAGCILNLWLGLGIWDYSHLPGNILGQICPQFAAIWFVLMPTCIWMEDSLRWGLGWNGKQYSWLSIYWDLITLK